VAFFIGERLSDVEVTQRGVVFPGASGSSAIGDQSMAKSFSQEHDRIAPATSSVNWPTRLDRRRDRAVLGQGEYTY